MPAARTSRLHCMKLDDLKKLHQRKYRTQLGCYLIEGEHLILELQKAAKTQEHLKGAELYLTEEHENWAHHLASEFTIYKINKKQMAQLSNTKNPQGLIACVPLPHLAGSQTVAKQQALDEMTLKPGERCIYLHEVQDPGNLGTILRSLAWFGNFRLLLSPNSVDPFNPKVVRASMGAIFHVPIELDIELSNLRKRFKNVAYLDMQGSKVNSDKFANYDCYLFGNEARGVPLEKLSAFNADAFTIKGCGIIDSLNLASAVNICVYQLSI